MQIKHLYSHLNGYEYLLVHHQDLWNEVLYIINSLDASYFKTKESKEKGRIGKLLYNPVEINEAFKQMFYQRGWQEERQTYYLTSDQELAIKTMRLNSSEQKRIIESEGVEAFKSSNQTDFVKNKVAVEIQFGKYAFVAYDLFVKHMAFFIANKIDVGIEIIPT